MTFFIWQTFPSSGQWPIYFKQHLIDQSFPTIKDLSYLKKENCNRILPVSCLFFPQSFTVTISALSGGSTGRVGDPGIPEMAVPHPAYISVMFDSFDRLSDATRRGKSPCFSWTVMCGYLPLLPPLWPEQVSATLLASVSYL